MLTVLPDLYLVIYVHYNGLSIMLYSFPLLSNVNPEIIFDETFVDINTIDLIIFNYNFFT